MIARTFTVLIPTHDHADTLWYSVNSVLSQTCQDFEVFIIGDGVPDRTREIVTALMAQDARIRFFDNPKGSRHGEDYRHAALQQANGKYISYLSDDDLWFPEHLERMAELLAGHDLVHSMQISVEPNIGITSWLFDADASKEELEKMRRSETGFSLSSGAHTLEAYRKLPKGWHAAPKDIYTDLYFWLQCLDQPGCRYYSLKWPTLCHFSSASRREWSSVQRIAELAEWSARISSSDARNSIIMRVMLPLIEDAFASKIRETSPQINQSLLQKEIERLQQDIHAIKNSHSWKITSPIRWVMRKLFS